MLALMLAALAVGLGNFAVSIGIGLSGADTATRIRVGAVFAVFESGMPLVGLVAGHRVWHALGHVTRYAGGGLLITIGLWSLFQTVRVSEERRAPTTSPGRLVLTGLALSMDNLVVGFGLGVQAYSLGDAIIVFDVVAIGLSVLGLEFGRRLGSVIESRAEYLASMILIIVGCLVASGVI